MNENKKTIEQKIDSAIGLFRKDSNTTFLGIAKLIKAALVNNKHSEEPVSELEVLQKMAKEREKSITIYKKAGRNDLAIKETRELGYIQGLMPKEPSESEVKEFIKNWIEEYKDVMTIDVKCTRLIIGSVLDRYPTAQKSTIVKIFKSLL